MILRPEVGERDVVGWPTHEIQYEGHGGRDEYGLRDLLLVDILAAEIEGNVIVIA